MRFDTDGIALELQKVAALAATTRRKTATFTSGKTKKNEKTNPQFATNFGDN
jgi:hypothetical protein